MLSCYIEFVGYILWKNTATFRIFPREYFTVSLLSNIASNCQWPLKIMDHSHQPRGSTIHYSLPKIVWIRYVRYPRPIFRLANPCFKSHSQSACRLTVQQSIATHGIAQHTWHFLPQDVSSSRETGWCGWSKPTPPVCFKCPLCVALFGLLATVDRLYKLRILIQWRNAGMPSTLYFYIFEGKCSQDTSGKMMILMISCCSCVRCSVF